VGPPAAELHRLDDGSRRLFAIGRRVLRRVEPACPLCGRSRLARRLLDCRRLRAADVSDRTRGAQAQPLDPRRSHGLAPAAARLVPPRRRGRVGKRQRDRPQRGGGTRAPPGRDRARGSPHRADNAGSRGALDPCEPTVPRRARARALGRGGRLRSAPADDRGRPLREPIGRPPYGAARSRPCGCRGRLPRRATARAAGALGGGGAGRRARRGRCARRPA
jgi:hypothetical protein